MPRLKTIDLEGAIKKILEEYKVDCTEGMKEAVKEATKAGSKKVASNAREKFNGKVYASGWTSIIEDGRLSAQGYIYNSKVPGLPHLLENGHAKRGGGRYLGEIHIAPVEKELVEAFQKDIEGKL